MTPGKDLAARVAETACVVDVEDFDTRKACSCGEMVKTGLAGKAPVPLSDVCTLTTPVFPPLVVTRMDCESLMHTVLSSCLASGLVGPLLVDLFTTTFGSVVFLGAEPPEMLLKLGVTTADGVLAVLVSFNGATCWTGTLFSGMVKPEALDKYVVVLGRDAEVLAALFSAL